MVDQKWYGSNLHRPKKTSYFGFVDVLILITSICSNNLIPWSIIRTVTWSKLKGTNTKYRCESNVVMDSMPESGCGSHLYRWYNIQLARMHINHISSGQTRTNLTFELFSTISNINRPHNCENDRDASFWSTMTLLTEDIAQGHCHLIKMILGNEEQAPSRR